MKRTVRILSLLMILAVVMLSTASCGFLKLMDSLPEQTEAGDSTTGDATESTTDPGTESTTDDSSSPDDPSAGDEIKSILERYPYTLTQEDVDDFYEMLDVCEALLLPDGTETEQIDHSITTMTDAYYHISTQANLAYLIFSMDSDNEEASDAYLFASGASSDCYAAYMKLCKKVDGSQSAYRDTFFSDWSEADISLMRTYTDEMAELQKQQDALLVEYRELSDAQFRDGSARIFAQTVAINNAMAELMGYDNYMEYAYELSYQREYTPEDAEQIRAYTKEYLIPLCSKLLTRFQGTYGKFNQAQANTVYSFLYDDYDAVSTDLLDGYLESLPQNLRDAMKGMFEDKNVIFNDNAGGLEGAFTGYLYDYNHPVCYFGPGYQNTFTLVHELGHYAAFEISEGLNTPMDLAEVHSQGNEFLMLAYTQDVNTGATYRALGLYQCYQTIASTIACVIVDEFEQAVYTTGAGAEDFDGIMAAICAEYGGDDFLNNYVTDMDSYWRYVVVESPGYYISYATSGLAALELYAVASEDYEEGVRQYHILVDEARYSSSLTDALVAADLHTPFQEELYLALQEVFQ